MGSISEKKILIVEDELILSMYEEQIVEKIGCKVVGKVTSGEEALNIFEEAGPDLVLIDIGLTGSMDGVQLIKKMRETSKIPAVIISGESNRHIHRLNYQQGYTELIHKPFSSNDLLTAVERILTTEH